MLRGKMPHFRLTSVAQKRLCLSSSFSVVQATETLSFLFSFRGWRKDGRLVIFNLICLLRIGNDGLQWRGYVLGEGGGWEGRVRVLPNFEFQTPSFSLLRVKQGRSLSFPVSVFKKHYLLFSSSPLKFQFIWQSCLAIINLPRVADLRLCRLLEFAIMGSYHWGFLFEKTETLVES